MKILLLDIETAPNTAYVWSLFKEFVPLDRLIATGRVMCFSYCWHGDKNVQFVSEQDKGHEDMVRVAHALCEEADAIVTYNGDRFDIPTLHREFVKYGLSPPSPCASIDLYKTVRKRFRFPSNKLDHVCKELDLGQKMRHEGFELWVKCMNGDAMAWKSMKRYNKHDVKLVVKLYDRLLPWISGHPNHAHFVKKLRWTTCPHCGKDSLTKRGFYITKTRKYQRWQCTDCGSWSRSRVSTRNDHTEVFTPL